MTVEVRRHKLSPHWLVVEVEDQRARLLGRFISKAKAEEHLNPPAA